LAEQSTTLELRKNGAEHNGLDIRAQVHKGTRP